MQRPRPAPPTSSWNKRVWLLAGPIIVSNLSVPLVGAVDTAVVGHLPDQVFIGAVALGAVVFSFLYWGFGFLRMGTTGFVSQAYGAGDKTEVGLTLGRSLVLAVVLGALVFLLQRPVARIGLALIEGTPELERLAADYFFTGYLATLLLHCSPQYPRCVRPRHSSWAGL